MRLKIIAALLLVFALGSQSFSAAPPLHFTELPAVLDMFRPPPPPDASAPDWIPDALSFWETAIPIAPEEADYLAEGEEIIIPLPLAEATMLPAPPRPLDQYQPGIGDIAGHWAEQAILANIERGMVHIQAEGNVQPNQPITRGEFVFSLDRWITANYSLLQSMGFTYTGANLAVIGVPHDHPFRASIDSLALLGMIGGDVAFMADEYVQRQEVSRIFLNLFMRLSDSSFDIAYFAGLNVSAILSQYYDEEDIAGWARDSVALMTDRGFMGGAGGDFRPTDAITRAEAHMTFQNIERHLRD